MKLLTKKIFLIICILALVASAVGCTPANNEEPKIDNDGLKVDEEESKADREMPKADEYESKVDTEEPKSDDKDTDVEEAYSQELAKYFPSVEGTVLNYFGTVEYGQTLTLSKVIENEDRLILGFKGEMLDLSGGESSKKKEDFILETEYEIDKDSVKEIQRNEERRYSQSIIREQIVLKTPIEEGKKWNQTVNIDGKEYTVETKITEISKDEKGKGLVKTETIIKDIESYPENTYQEVRTYKEDKGLVSFSTMILLKGSEGQEDTPFEFGYRIYEQE
ncbi:hypothetical protein R9X47_14860 [Wukongibacter baidiensis]|uniref:hypothetical protein n=1 Tax=Wukongibacter baidiensis TaxID=1723361 RepID=UPI003D7FFADA